MPKYILDPCVEDELWGIWHFIAQDNPDAATRVIEAAYETFKTLAANPGIWQAEGTDGDNKFSHQLRQHLANPAKNITFQTS
jgi:plasmid stabilization system protein ParE